MSYILDALRKSEQQRQRSTATLLLTTQISANVEKHPVSLFYGLIAVILICFGILIGWFQPWQQVESVHKRNSVANAKHEEKLPKIKPITQHLLLDSEKSIKPEMLIPLEKSISIKKSTPNVNIANQDVVALSKDKPLPHESQTSGALLKVQEQKMDKAKTSSEGKVIESPIANHDIDNLSEASLSHKIVALTELPLTIQQEIPTMTISGYAYSNIPKERIVGINDHLYQEGDYLAPGLRLEEIVADGLVFSYKKYLFRHSL